MIETFLNWLAAKLEGKPKCSHDWEQCGTEQGSDYDNHPWYVWGFCTRCQEQKRFPEMQWHRMEEAKKRTKEIEAELREQVLRIQAGYVSTGITLDQLKAVEEDETACDHDFRYINTKSEIRIDHHHTAGQLLIVKNLYRCRWCDEEEWREEPLPERPEPEEGACDHWLGWSCAKVKLVHDGEGGLDVFVSYLRPCRMTGCDHQEWVDHPVRPLSYWSMERTVEEAQRIVAEYHADQERAEEEKLYCTHTHEWEYKEFEWWQDIGPPYDVFGDCNTRRYTILFKCKNCPKTFARPSDIDEVESLEEEKKKKELETMAQAHRGTPIRRKDGQPHFGSNDMVQYAVSPEMLHPKEGKTPFREATPLEIEVQRLRETLKEIQRNPRDIMTGNTAAAALEYNWAKDLHDARDLEVVTLDSPRYEDIAPAPPENKTQEEKDAKYRHVEQLKKFIIKNYGRIATMYVREDLEGFEIRVDLEKPKK